MKVGICANKLDPKRGGAATLIDTIREELKETKSDFDVVILCRGGRSEAYETRHDGLTYINTDRVRLKYSLQSKLDTFPTVLENTKRRLINRAEIKGAASWLDILCRKEKIDLLWFTEPSNERTSCPYIFTVWDLGHRIAPFFPEVSSPLSNWKSRENTYQEMLYRASYILTGNEQGKKEILENYSISPEKIKIVPFPVTSLMKKDEKKPEFEIPDTFFLYPAQFWPHKNHIRIIKALSILKQKHSMEPVIIFTGSDKGNRRYIEESARKLGVDRQVIFGGFVRDEELKYLYTHARAMIFASLLGPNNLPPVEAASVGCPVLITDIPGHREQMGDAAIYFDGLDEEDLSKKISYILDDNNRIDILSRQKDFQKGISDYRYTSEVLRLIKEFFRYRETWSEN